MSFDMSDEFRASMIEQINGLTNSIQGIINTTGTAFKDKFNSNPSVEGYIKLYMVQPLSDTSGVAPTSNLFHNIVETSKDWASSNASIHHVSETLYCGEDACNAAQEFERDIIEKFEKLDSEFDEVIEKYKGEQINQTNIDTKTHEACNEITGTMVSQVSSTLQTVGENIQNGENDNTAAQKVAELINNFIRPCVASFFKQAFGMTVEEKETRAKLESMFVSEKDTIAAGIDSLNNHTATLIN